MQTLSCPIPNNINPLQSNGFLFDILKLPELKFFCQEVTLPTLDAPAANFDTPMVNVPLPGEKLSFGELSVTFMIDENMANYIALHNWMIGLGFPENHEQYRNFIGSRTDAVNPNEALASYSDALLQVLTSANTPARTIQFVDLFPTGLQQITLQSNTQETTYLAATASFGYTYYKFV